MHNIEAIDILLIRSFNIIQNNKTVVFISIVPPTDEYLQQQSDKLLVIIKVNPIYAVINNGNVGEKGCGVELNNSSLEFLDEIWKFDRLLP